VRHPGAADTIAADEVSARRGEWIVDGYRALARGDVAGALCLLDRRRRYAPGADTALLHALLFALDAVEVLEQSAVHFTITRAPDTTLVRLRVSGSGRDAGTAIDFTVAHLWTEEDDRVGFQWFDEPVAGMQALERRRSRRRPDDSASAGGERLPAG
jgi:hypothetical protein